jgi:hypothetical protein
MTSLQQRRIFCATSATSVAYRDHHLLAQESAPFAMAPQNTIMQLTRLCKIISAYVKDGEGSTVLYAEKNATIRVDSR